MCYDINCGHPDCSTIVRIPCEDLNYCRKVDMSQRGWQSVGPDPELCEEHLPWDYKTGARGKATVRWRERYNKMRRSAPDQKLGTESEPSSLPHVGDEDQQAIVGPLNGPLNVSNHISVMDSTQPSSYHGFERADIAQQEGQARPSANRSQEDLQPHHDVSDRALTSQLSSLEAFEAAKAGAKRFRRGQFHPYDNPYADHKRQKERHKGSRSVEDFSKKDSSDVE